MGKASGSVDLKGYNDASKIATSYVTEISNDGVFVHQTSNSSVTPTDNGANGVFITNKIDIIRDGTSVSEYGETVRVGTANNAHLSIDKTDTKIYGYANELALSYGTKNNNETGIATVTDVLTTVYINDGNIDGYVLNPSRTVSEVTSALKNDGTAVVLSIVTSHGHQYLYNSLLDEGDEITVIYTTLQQVPYLQVGSNVNACGANSFVVGENSIARGSNSVAIGESSKSYGSCSLAVGRNSTSKGTGSIAIGSGCNSSGWYSLSIGANTTASGTMSFAQGYNSNASGTNSAAFGQSTEAIGFNSVAFGQASQANAARSFAAGASTIVTCDSGFACGKFNVSNNNTLFAVGNGEGTSAEDRSDAFWVGESGNIGVQGRLYSGGPESTGRKTMFATDSITEDNISIAANSNSGTITIDISKSGYTPMAIRGIRINNATTGGAIAHYCNLYAWSISGNNLVAAVRNTATGTTAVIKIIVDVFYIATSAV